MHCYLCLMETGETGQPASAICQSCGAAICVHHAMELRRPSGGMAMTMYTTPPYRMMCQRCFAVIAPAQGLATPQPHQRPSTQAGAFWKKWWKRFKRQQPTEPSTELPDTGEMISAVETFLLKGRVKRQD